MSRVTENEVAEAVLRIAASKDDLICTLDDAREKIPDIIALSSEDLAPSPTRVGEPLWHQQIRNIQSHHDADGNFINEGFLEHVDRVGYRATRAGLDYLK